MRSLTLDGFARFSGIVPDLIKIDCGGAELLCSKAPEELLAAHHPDLIVGVHPFWMPVHILSTRSLAFFEHSITK